MASVILNAVSNDPLRGLIPDWILNNTRTEVTVPERVCVTCDGPSDGYDGPSALVKIGSNPDRGVIQLHPDYYTPQTAGGEALRAHELYHVWQREVYPNFEQDFLQAAIDTEKAGLPPWENPFEKPAYEFEAQVRDHLLEQGYPARWQ